jgi:hypothetical protein
MNMVWGGVQVVLLGAAALGYGGVAAQHLAMGKSFIEQLYTRFALGLGLVILATTAAGWLRLWGPWFHHGILAAGILLLARRPPRADSSTSPLFQRRDLLWATPVLALLLFYAAFPPTFYDALLYHLGVPGYYLQSGGFASWPENLFSALPQNAEMLNLLLLSGGSIHGPKLLSLAAALALVLYLADWGRTLRLRHTWLPALIFFSIPEVVFLAATEKNDILLMLFLLPGVRCLVALKNDPGNWRAGAAGGIFLGLAGGVKWQGLLYGAAFVCAYFLTSRAPLGKRFRHIVLIGFIVILLIAPWLLKNQATFGNPVHPYLSGLFSEGNAAAGQARQISAGVRRGQGFAPGTILSFCLRMFLSPYSLGLTHITGVIVLLLLPLLFLPGKTGKNGLLLAGCAFGFLVMLATSRVPRYFLPIFMVLAIPLAAAWDRMEEMVPRFRRLALLLLFSLTAIQAVQAVSLLERMTLGARFVVGKWRGTLPAGARYLDVVPYYPAVSYINRALALRARVAFIGEERTFYIQRPFLCASSYDANPILADFLASADAAAWAEKLRRRGITHVLYCHRGLLRMSRNSNAQKISPQQERRLGEALGRWPKRYADSRYSLFQVDH